MFELRRAVPDDIDQIWSVRTLAIRVGCRGHYPDDDVQRWASVTMHSGFSDVVAGTKSYVIADGRRIKAFGLLDLGTSEVCGMFVHPAYIGNGLGRTILTTLEMEAKQAKLKSLWLASTLNAERFYVSAGFKSEGRSKWNHPDGFELDCVKMNKEL